MGYRKFKFGMLYLWNNPKHIPQQCNSGGDTPCYDGKATISIKEEANEWEPITWVKPSGMNLLIADRVLLAKVAWSSLYQSGFVIGKEITIGRNRFRCRLPHVGASQGEPNEWDQALDIAGSESDLWHETGMYFWGAEKSHYSDKSCAVRGFVTARHWNTAGFSAIIEHIGFRPVLEPLGVDSPISNCTLDGTNFRLSSIPGGDGPCPILQPIQKDVFADIPEGRGVAMYTFLEDGHPISPYGPFHDKSRLKITDKYFGDEYLIPWVVSNGIAVGYTVLSKAQ